MQLNNPSSEEEPVIKEEVLKP